MTGCKSCALAAIFLSAFAALWGQSALPMRARSRGAAIPPVRPALPIGTPIKIANPLGLPPVPIPADNPPTAETVALGRKLFFDPVLSRDNTVSCASCHDPKHGMADPRPSSEGVHRA